MVADRRAATADGRLVGNQISRPMKLKRVMHPNSLNNLKPYKPGENGHQGGYSLKERLMHSLDKPLVEPKPDACAGDHIVYSTLVGAKLREPTPFKEVWDRTEGKVIDTHEIKGVIPITVVEIVKDYGDSGRPEALSPGT